ncbi:hypothetical protein PHAVU_009G044100 [Phaseolus vulgaris]|uniref:DUF7804 domain-containing protein n=1 Tax=Phaseolus vulgaris TaxID=3885 RepID=V7AS72_PHAVU|nr:hypothetical protein PHAVU_009G044100g [Phaseolus vulgaris]ESW08419.1 hypothetical protein PHAVU_009G044100g [Phaseolus vulgaris]
MASSKGIACAGNSRIAANFGIRSRSGLAIQPPCSVAIARSTAKAGRISAEMATERASVTSVELPGKRKAGANDAVEGHERLDRWMKESVVDIVKNLREAPLLVQVYPKLGAAATTTEKRVLVEDWPAVKERWEKGESPMPEGVIFVEELEGDDAEEGSGERTTRAWGVVVQGKGVGCGPVCYLLKTCRVGSGPGNGMGVCSTHFCLVKVKDLRERVQSQLKNCWLLQSQWK